MSPLPSPFWDTENLSGGVLPDVTVKTQLCLLNEVLFGELAVP